MTVLERIVAALGRRIDESNPLVDARLQDGSRVNAIIPPLAIDGPALTIRKFGKRALTSDDPLKYQAITQEMVDFLKTSVLIRKNILISGGTGSGKTTLLNTLSSFIPSSERIVTIMRQNCNCTRIIWSVLNLVRRISKVVDKSPFVIWSVTPCAAPTESSLENVEVEKPLICCRR